MFFEIIYKFIKMNFRFMLLAAFFIVLIAVGNKLLRNYFIDADIKHEDAKSVVVSIFKNENKELKNQLETITNNAKIDNDQIVINMVQKETIKETSQTVKNNLIVKVANIKDKNTKPIVNPGIEPLKEQSMELATVRINALWETFCIDNTNEECRGV